MDLVPSPVVTGREAMGLFIVEFCEVLLREVSTQLGGWRKHNERAGPSADSCPQSADNHSHLQLSRVMNFPC
jgi:hypothetical protein